MIAEVSADKKDPDLFPTGFVFPFGTGMAMARSGRP